LNLSACYGNVGIDETVSACSHDIRAFIGRRLDVAVSPDRVFRRFKGYSESRIQCGGDTQ